MYVRALAEPDLPGTARGLARLATPKPGLPGMGATWAVSPEPGLPGTGSALAEPGLPGTAVGGPALAAGNCWPASRAGWASLDAISGMVIIFIYVSRRARAALMAAKEERRGERVCDQNGGEDGGACMCSWPEDVLVACIMIMAHAPTHTHYYHVHAPPFWACLACLPSPANQVSPERRAL